MVGNEVVNKKKHLFKIAVIVAFLKYFYSGFILWEIENQGGHGTGNTGNLVITFSRQGNTGNLGTTQGKFGQHMK